MNEHILLAYNFTHGHASALDHDAVNSHIDTSSDFIWLHMDATHKDTRNWLEAEATNLDHLIIEALLADETRPHMSQINNGVLLILRGPNLNEDSDPEDMVSIRLWIEEHRIISLRRRNLKAISDIQQRIINGKTIHDVADFICQLTARLSQRMETALSNLTDLTDSIEEEVLENANDSLRNNIIDVRKKAILFRRYMAPQRDAIGQLRMSDVAWLSHTNKRQLQEIYNHATRYIEDLDTIRERSQIVKDELSNMLTSRLNNNLYMLSVISAIFLPLGFLTGLFGVNVGGIPGSDNVDAFWLFCGLLGIIVIVQMISFKKLRWF